MESFIDRKGDLASLQDEFDRKDASLVILYGRRRLGKTALAAEFGRDKNMLYFLATEESEASNIMQFQKTVVSFTGNTVLQNVRADNWDVLFDVLAEYMPSKRKLIVLDEFQYLGKTNPAFPSVFQKIWDTKLKKSNVMVVLCGSLISLMEKQTLSYNSPLYGRRTGQIKLKPIPFSAYADFYPKKSRRELVEYYSVTGGVPKYIELFESERSIYTAIKNHILSPNSFLYEEPVFLLHHEVAEIGSYFSLIRVIAAGNRKLADIASVLGAKQTGLTGYLRTLIDLGILRRETPVTEKNPEKSKRGRYHIDDPFLEFWFKFVYPYRGQIETGHADIVENKIKESFIERHVAYIYEDVCREEIWRLSAEGRLPHRFDKVGAWWDGQDEIDICATSESSGTILFGECKYRNAKMDTDVFSALKTKAQKVPLWQEERKEIYALFSISGFTKQLKELAQKRDDLYLFE